MAPKNKMTEDPAGSEGSEEDQEVEGGGDEEEDAIEETDGERFSDDE